jgi:hypothetical protein
MAIRQGTQDMQAGVQANDGPTVGRRSVGTFEFTEVGRPLNAI